MILSKREKFILWKLLEFPMHRYLLSIERSGFERAERHMEFSKVLWVRELKTAFAEHHEEWMKVHDLIAEKVTNDLPRSIGYVFKEEKDWDLLTDRLFEAILKVLK